MGRADEAGVEKLTDEDMISLAAFLGSLDPKACPARSAPAPIKA